MGAGRDSAAHIYYSCRRSLTQNGGGDVQKELMWLTLTVILTGILWVPYVIDRAMVRGLMGCDGQPVALVKPQSPWAQRL